MGMDVFGRAPSAPVGEYFRNNVWWWRPLADFVCERYPELAAGCEYWQSNDGDGLDEQTSIELAGQLRADLASGVVAEYEQAHTARLAALPDETCWLCAGAGVRTDEVGVQMGLDCPRDPETGQGGCNGCAGTGTRRPSEASYPFSAENVAEFAEFLAACGGFRIC